jgi:hypothetical protein
MREGAALIIIIRDNDCYTLQVLNLEPPILLVRGCLNTIVPHHSAFKQMLTLL